MIGRPALYMFWDHHNNRFIRERSFNSFYYSYHLLPHVYYNLCVSFPDWPSLWNFDLFRLSVLVLDISQGMEEESFHLWI